jgi:hypothetical protein
MSTPHTPPDMAFHRLVALMALLTACAGPTRGCDVCTQSATVYGTVSDGAGEPAGGAEVRAYVGAEPCAARPAPEEAGRTAADGAGRYRLQVKSVFPAAPCVQLEATRAGGTPVRVEVPAVRFKPTAQASLPYDSVRVDVRVP